MPNGPFLRLLPSFCLALVWLNLASGSVYAAKRPKPGVAGQEQPAEALPRPKIWRVEADPPSEAVKLAAATPAAPLQLKGRPDFVVPFLANSRIALSGGSGTSVYDLLTGRVASDLRDQPMHTFQLSPSGNLLAGFNTKSRAIEVWDLRAKRLRRDWPMDIYTGQFRFAGEKSLLMIGGAAGKTTVQVHDLATKDEPREIELAPLDTIVTVSPGGRYLVLNNSNQLRIQELPGGEIVGEVDLPKSALRGSCSLDGIEFSPDGRELAALVNRVSQSAIVNWDVITGICSTPMPVRMNMPGESGAESSTIHWSPNKKLWLVGNQILVDRVSGKVMWPEGGTRTVSGKQMLRFVDDNSLMILEAGFDQHKVWIEKLPEGLLERMTAAVAAGGSATDAMLSPAKQADLTSGTRLQPFSGTAAWQGEEDPSPKAARWPKGPFKLDAEIKKVQQVRFATEASQVVVRLNKYSDTHGNVDPDQSIDCFAVPSGRSKRHIPIPAILKLVDVTPDGQWALLDRFERLELWSLADKKAMVAFRVPGSPVAQGGKPLSLAALVDNSHVASLNNYQFVLWELPSCRALAVVDRVRGAAVTPGRRQIVLFSDSGAGALLDAHTGELRGKFAAPSATGESQNPVVAVASDGTRVLVGDGQSLAIWRLSDGQLESQFAHPLTHKPQFLGHRFVIDFSKLTDVAQSGVVGTLIGPIDDQNLQKVWGSPDGRLWTIVSQRLEPGAWLGALDPAPTEEGQNALVPILTKGGTVAIDLGAVPLTGENQGKAVENITRSLAAGGISVKAGAPLRFVGEMRLAESKNVEVQSRGIMAPGVKRENFTATDSRYDLKLKLVDQQNRELWQTTGWAVASVPTISNSRPNESAQAMMQRVQGEELQGYLERFFLNVRPPRTIYPPAKQLGDRHISPEMILGAERVVGNRPVDPSKPPAAAPSAPAVASAPQNERVPKRVRPGARTAEPAPPMDKQETAAVRAVRQHLVELLTLDNSELLDNVRWLSALERPVAGIRWGLAEQSGNITARSPAKVEMDTGLAGKTLLAGLDDRIGHGEFDNWRSLAEPALRSTVIVGSSQGRSELTAAARERGLDLILALTVKVASNADPRQAKATLSAKVVDVSFGSPGLEFKGLTSTANAQNREQAAREWAEEALSKIDEAYSLQLLPELDTARIKPRLEALAKKKSANPLAVLVEIRTYQALKLLKPDAAAELMAKAVGPGAKPVAGDNAQARRRALVTLFVDSKE